MNTTPCPQPPGEPFDNKPRVIVLKEDLENLQHQLAQMQHKVEAAEAKEYEANSVLQMFKDAKPDGSAESYLRIWQNCLGDRLYPKSHWIDALGKTTRLLNSDKRMAESNCDQLRTELEQCRKDLASARDVALVEAAECVPAKRSILDHETRDKILALRCPR